MGLNDTPPSPGPLPSASLKWASWVTRGFIDLSQKVAALGGNSTAQGKGSTTTAMSLQQQVNAVKEAQEQLAAAQGIIEQQQNDLAQQQDYLASLVTYAEQGPTISSNNNSGSMVTAPENTPSITFTLPQQLKCRITLRGQAFIAVSGSAANTFANGTILAAIGMDGAIYSGGGGRAYLSSQPGSAANYNFTTTGDIVAQVIVDLDAGEHEAYSQFRFQGNGASINLSVQAPTMTVEVIGLP